MNKHRPRRSTKSPSLFSHLPEELIPQILLRLPVRSLLRFKSVCKSWHSLISDPQFGKSHYDLAASPTYRCLTIANDSEIGSIDVDASLLNYESTVVKLKYPVPPPREIYLFSYNTVWFLGYCRGFIIVVYEQGDVFVWNPSTGVHEKFDISHVSDRRFDYLHGFGYDTSTDDYLIVCLVLIPYDFYQEDPADYPTRISLFSFKTNSWFYLEGTYVQYWDNGERDFKVGCLLNEALHWLVTSYETKLQVVIAFDLVQRTLSEIPLSPTLSRKLEHKKYRYHLKVMGECLSLCYPGGGSSMVEIWVMKEYKVSSSWTKLFVFSTCNIPNNMFFPICLTKDGKFFGSGYERLMILNSEGWLLDMCILRPEPDIQKYIDVHHCMYRESLLSLPMTLTKQVKTSRKQGKTSRKQGKMVS